MFCLLLFWHQVLLHEFGHCAGRFECLVIKGETTFTVQAKSGIEQCSNSAEWCQSMPTRWLTSSIKQPRPPQTNCGPQQSKTCKYTFESTGSIWQSFTANGRKR